MRKVIITLQGGLGNQLFQYAFGQVIAQRHNVDVLYDDLNYSPISIFSLSCILGLSTPRRMQLHRFGIKINKPSWWDRITIGSTGIHKILRVFFGLKTPAVRTEFHANIYDPTLLQLHKSMSCCYIGYRNVAKYYEGQKDIISNIKLEKKSHSFKEKERLLQQQHQEGCETIAIHVRRGDYIKLGLVVCDETYYKQALVSIANKIGHNNIHIYVFSDDDSQTQKELSFLQNYNVTYINFDDYEKTHNIDNKGFDDVEKLIFMSQCKHHIIANSTYSRWGAWLSKNNGIVIAPKMRTRTISSEKVLPSDWIKI